MKPTDYEALCEQLAALLEGETDPIVNMANTSALLFVSLDDVNWAGFYRLIDDQLVLGPFQGRPACTRIKIGKGVCGTAAKARIPLLVEDVEEFPGHIACDPHSKSELAVPIIKGGQLSGVLDLDSPTLGRFHDADRIGIEKVIQVFLNATVFQ
ncbi:MAG: GAF domain-containing protein [Planctomycetia bacterium]|jgi:GAF domain-containing protein